MLSCGEQAPSRFVLGCPGQRACSRLSRRVRCPGGGRSRSAHRRRQSRAYALVPHGHMVTKGQGSKTRCLKLWEKGIPEPASGLKEVICRLQPGTQRGKIYYEVCVCVYVCMCVCVLLACFCLGQEMPTALRKCVAHLHV